jgi:hypothetical protein
MPLNWGIFVHNKINTLRSVILFLVVLTLNCCSKDGAISFAGGGSYQAAGRAMMADLPAVELADRTSRAYDDSMGNLYGGAAEEPEIPALNQELAAQETGRKLVKTARIQTRVDNLKESAVLLETILERYGAYASSSNIRSTSESYTLKIPGEHYDTALQEIGAIGKIIYRSETAEDVTIRFYDLDGRLNTRLELLKTFQTYLGKAANIDEIMIVEKRIAELQQEIDWYGSQLADLSHLTSYATVNLELLGPVSESTYYKPSLGERIAGLFRSFADVASMALLVLLGIVIYGIPALIILILIFWILFGRIGLIRRIWRLAGTKNQKRRHARRGLIPRRTRK